MSQENEKTDIAAVLARDETDVAPSDDTVTSEGRNAKHIYCRLCGCVMLNPGKAEYVENSIFLHYDKKTAQSRAAALAEADLANGLEIDLTALDTTVEGVNGQTLSHFWKVKDMFDFENLAFTKSVKLDQHRYLTCADCEIEIVGINHLPGYVADPNTHYIACSRIAYDQVKGGEEARAAANQRLLGAVMAMKQQGQGQSQQDAKVEEL